LTNKNPNILEWAFLHRTELEENWDLSKENKKLKKIEPLI